MNDKKNTNSSCDIFSFYLNFSDNPFSSLSFEIASPIWYILLFSPFLFLKRPDRGIQTKVFIFVYSSFMASCSPVLSCKRLVTQSQG